MIPALIALITAFATLFIGGEDLYRGTFFEVQNNKKIVKQHIDDKERRKEAVALVKEYNKEISALRKSERKIIKNLNKATKDVATPKGVLDSAIAEIMAIEAQINATWITARQKLVVLISQEEFEAILETITPTEKREIKADKAYQKAFEKRSKYFSTLHDVIEEVIVDDAEKEKVTASLAKYQQAIEEYYARRKDVQYTKNETLDNYNASVEDLEALLNENNQMTTEILATYSAFHIELTSQIKPEEWKQIRKKMKQVVK